MNISDVISSFTDHIRSNLKPRTIKNYELLLNKFEALYGERHPASIGSDEISQFLEELTFQCNKSTRRFRYAQLKTFFNFVIDKYNLDIKNPCSIPTLSKTFRMPNHKARKVLDKETVDGMVYSANCLRDRLVIELQARCGLRIGELLKLKAGDVSDRKILIQQPKSGSDSEVAFMPEQIAKRLVEYMKEKNLSEDDQLFPMCYSTARSIVKGACEEIKH